MKKALSLLLALAMSLGMLGASALAEDVPPQEESAVQAPSVWAYDALAAPMPWACWTITTPLTYSPP